MGDLTDRELIGLLVLITFTVLLVFHGLVLASVVPMKFVWGGRIDDRSELLKMELISIFVLLFCAALVSLRCGFLPWSGDGLAGKIGIWLVFALFALNTLGNLMAKTQIERWVFTPVTLLLAAASLYLALA